MKRLFLAFFYYVMCSLWSVPVWALVKDASRLTSEAEALPVSVTENGSFYAKSYDTSSAGAALEMADAAEGQTPDDLAIGDIPVIEPMELTTDIAKRALDVYALVKQKYSGSQIDEFENWQDFIDQNPRGKELEADVKAKGFSSLADWNRTITNVSFAYSTALEDQTHDIQNQINEIKADSSMAQDMKDRMVAALSASIPSKNNLEILRALLKEADYKAKLESLDLTDE